MDDKEAKIKQMIRLALYGVDPEKLEEVMAQSFEKTGMPNIIPKDVYQFRRSLDFETDRGCVLMATAYLDEKLKELLKHFLIEDNDSFNSLFSGVGGLSTFSSRIELSYLLGLISPMVKRDLHIIRKIRNVFAHSAENIDFNHPPIASRCRELYHNVFEGQLSPRQSFIRVSFGVAGRINGAKMINERRKQDEDVDIKDESMREQGIKLMNAIKQKSES